MPYVNKPRPYAKEYQQQLARGEADERRKRENARDLYDREGIDRKGKDIDHKVPLSKGGGATKSNLRLTTPAENRSFSRTSAHGVKSQTSKREAVAAKPRTKKK